jgi:signal transduction histidine kinase/CheY-like chemotaxis protein
MRARVGLRLAAGEPRGYGFAGGGLFMLPNALRINAYRRVQAVFLPRWPATWALPVSLAIAVSIAYFLAARLSLALLSTPDGVAVFWPAAGVAAGVLISLGKNARWPVIVGTMAATVAANLLSDRNMLSSIVFAVCNAGEAALIASLIERFFGSPFSLNTLRRVLGLLAATTIGTAVSGIGGTVGYLLFHSSTATALMIWTHWFTSDSIGVLTVTPLLIGLFSIWRDPPQSGEVLEGGLALALVAGLSGFVVHLPNDVWAVEVVVASLFPLFLFIAARCRPVFTATATFFFSLTIVWTTTFHIGVFGDASLPIDERVLSAQAAILAQSLCALVLAALFAERRQQETVLVESEARLQDALRATQQANHAKSTFLAAASHDLRQPLQTLSLLQRALKPHIQNGEARALLVRIGHSVEIMRDVLDSLLDINRLESGTLLPLFSDFPINDVFETMANEFLEPIREKGLTLQLVRSSIRVHSDRHMLEVIIGNLLSNAVKYTNNGRVLIGCRRAGDRVRIEVWDSGIGIDSDHIHRIFEEYYQIQRNSLLDGFGLGLAIVRRLGDLLGHHVDVHSLPGRGSCFSISVQMASESASTRDQFQMMSPAKAGEPFRGTILVIEDDSFVRSGLESLFGYDGLTVVSAAHGDEALALVTKAGVRPDLVLSDFNLPGPMNGVETIEALRVALASKVPAIVLTGDIRSQAIETITKHDVAVITKPFDGDKLLQLINQIGPVLTPPAIPTAPRSRR